MLRLCLVDTFATIGEGHGGNLVILGLLSEPTRQSFPTSPTASRGLTREWPRSTVGYRRPLPVVPKADCTKT
ncbi:MAG TPA: hypothetical protein VJU54_07590 [Nitrospiraceae bacterium]|nr:hypothetical protein [Nitrospiraceae bacterium]